MLSESNDEFIVANGINGSTGDYLTAPLLSESLLQYIERGRPPPYQDKLQEREEREDHLGLVYGVNPKNLAETGWGIIYGRDVTGAVIEALEPLVNLRQKQAGELFRRYNHIGESSREFLADSKVSLAGPADPREMPYYLLLVGGPEQISYDFQVELDVDRAVGRISFDTVEEYDNYACSVVAAENGEVRLPRRAAFFGVRNEGDNATRLTSEMLAEPLAQRFADRLCQGGRFLKWDVQSYLRDDARRSQLDALLGGDAAQTPALLFTAGHGMGFDFGDHRQPAHQGALLCSDWHRELGTVTEDVYFAGEHLAADARLHGLIAFFFACYGAGTPSHDAFMRKVEGQPDQIAPGAFVSALPRRMLSHPQGGALAVIGHVERAWTYSFKQAGKRVAHRGVFESTLDKLFDGYPIGDAFDFFNGRHASASVQLASLLKDKRRMLQVDDFELIRMWMINNDARYYVILGDPAVRLCVSEEAEETVQPSKITLNDIDLAIYRA